MSLQAKWHGLSCLKQIRIEKKSVFILQTVWFLDRNDRRGYNYRMPFVYSHSWLIFILSYGKGGYHDRG